MKIKRIIRLLGDRELYRVKNNKRTFIPYEGLLITERINKQQNRK